MRSSLNPDLFFQKMKKKPALQAILDNLDQYSEEQLSSIQGQPLWIREALVRLKKRGGAPVLTATQLADLMTHAPEPRNEEEYSLFEWTGDNGWLGEKQGIGAFEVEVNAGDAILILSPTEIMLGHSVIKINRVTLNRIYANSKAHGQLTLQKYKDFYRQLLNVKHV